MRRRNLEKISVLLTGVICLAVILNKTHLEENGEFNSVDASKVIRSQIDVSSPLPPQRSACEQNESASKVDGFSTLPNYIQDFLLYRHCRSFPMLLDVPNKCGGPQNSADVFLLLVVKSLPENYDRREVLRKTWAQERTYKGAKVRRVFLVGTSGTTFEKKKLNHLLMLENREHKDILQWDFHDSFFNLTLKQMLFLEWMERWCPQARFLLNGDDDIFANTFNMIEFLQGQEDNDGSKHLFSGHLIQNVGPIRERTSKYFIPVQVQESEKYPPYCGGGGFLLSGFTARTIYNMSHSITLLPIDDVYMGMCLERAGLKPASHFGVRTAGLSLPSAAIDQHDPCYYREIILVHRFWPLQIVLMWNEIQNPNLYCGKSMLSV
ncbi:N-acetyllactosaminide beta-1,3-N-acetylglucosaminyltransferase 3.4 [Misgurnus anguillicaudatus]|uniref:N-acetyllactosaminide beta-1,3-N-acetylglucosaminyltransferase 3.4 n=1 Tax=Misgurnus anguillicaudatus TaxID=75329 RepID=UPI002434C1F9|nr:N-acetyllactosaminide beta-1,3-N-acetylglucosaminyltransferase 3-like [Misgurnus anguillicaudatus]